MLRKAWETAPALGMRALLGATLVAVFGLAGCASRDASTADRSLETTPAELAASGAVQVTGATLLTDGDAPRLLLTGTGPLAPTVYTRDEGKRVVVDLANAVTAPGLEPPRADGQMLSQVGMRSFMEMGKPHLQFELATPAPVEPRLGTEPGTTAMAVALMRKGVPADVPREAPTAVAETRTKAADPEAIHVEALAEPTTSAPPAPVAVAAATPASIHHAAEGKSASHLRAVTSKKTKNGVEVLLAGDGDFSYDAFALESPARFVVDLAGVKNGAPRAAQDVHASRVDRLRVSQFKTAPDPVTRVVFDLSEGTRPTFVSTKQGLVLKFSASPVPETVAAARPVPQPEPKKADTPSAPASKEVVADAAPASGSYERHETEDVHEVVVKDVPAPTSSTPAETVASSAPAPTPSESTSPEIVASRSTTSEPKAEIKAPASVEFKDAKPVAQVKETKSTPEVHVAPPAMTEARPVRSRVTSAEDRSLLEAAEALLLQQDARAGSKDLTNPYESKTLGAGEKVYNGEPITLNLKDADIKDTLQRFSELTGLNIVLDPEVRGTVTVSLTDIPWDQALELILKINGLGYVLEGNVMRIATTAKLAQEETAKQTLLAAQEKNRPVKTVIQKLSYAQASDVATTARKVMSSRGDIYIDDRSNTLIIKELPDYLPTVLDLIKNLDAPTQQVMIEARIVEATRTFSKSLGIDWGFLGFADQTHGNTTGLVFPNHGTATGAVSLPAGSNILRLTLGNVLDTFQLDMTLSAAESHGLLKIISTPKVQAQTNQAASIQSGLQIPVQTVVNNTTTVLYIDATLRLDVTPQITSEGTVIMDIKVQKREPAPGINIASGNNIPLSTRDAKTKLMVRDGGTAVIGGIFKLNSNDSQSMIPGLWKIPLLGNLFRNRSENESSEELMIFITPRIMRS